MSGKNLLFNDKNINKSNFCKNKKLFNICDYLIYIVYLII